MIRRPRCSTAKADSSWPSTGTSSTCSSSTGSGPGGSVQPPTGAEGGRPAELARRRGGGGGGGLRRGGGRRADAPGADRGCLRLRPARRDDAAEEHLLLPE